MGNFKDFLRDNLYEDTATDLAQVQAQIAQLDTTINQRTVPLQQQKTRLQQRLAALQKRRQIEDKQKASVPPAGNTPTPPTT